MGLTINDLVKKRKKLIMGFQDTHEDDRLLSRLTFLQNTHDLFYLGRCVGLVEHSPVALVKRAVGVLKG